MDLFGKKRIAALEKERQESLYLHSNIYNALATQFVSIEKTLDELRKDKNRQAAEIKWIQTRLDRLDKPQND